MALEGAPELPYPAVRAGWLLASLLVAAPAWAGPPDFDAFLSSRAERPAPPAAGHIASVERRLGVPTVLWAARGQRSPEDRPEAAARAFLAAHAAAYRSDATLLEQLVPSGLHDTGRGAIIVSFGAQVSGVPVYRDEVNVVLSRERELLGITGYLSPHVVGTKHGEPRFELSPEAALVLALEDLTGELVSLGAFAPVERGEDPFERFALRGVSEVQLLRPARIRRVYYGLPEGLVEAYHLELEAQGGGASEHVAYVIGARRGELLSRRDLTDHQSFGYRVYADAQGWPLDGPMGNLEVPSRTGRPGPVMRQFVPQSLITLAHGPISTRDPWLSSSAAFTTGNNVDAYLDLEAPDGFSDGDLRAPLSGPATFDYAYDPLEAPDVSLEQRQAAVTHIFYVINFLHDLFYDLGLNEAARNAQESNYGRGGVAGDRIFAEGQDYSGRNNANMRTPADGASPRMQMYLYDGVDPSFVEVLAPVSATAQYATGLAAFGPRSFQLTGELVAVQDGEGDPSDGCSALTNAAEVAGRVALVPRGGCTFVVKARNAQEAGAIALVLTDDRPAALPPALTGNAQDVVIPAVSTTQADGQLLFAALAGGTAVSIAVEREARPDRDGTVNTLTIAHEWGHYVSNRLIGNASGLATSQSRGMGEGWSDFHALLLTVEESDALIPANQDWTGTYATSAYTARRGTYFGVRRVPYSTDFAKNGLTFRHIESGVPLPANVPTAFGLNGAGNAEVHATGEVWATALWECYVALLRDTGRLSFAEAQARMMGYLIAAYKATPVLPTFVEARDALFLVAHAGDPRDFEAFWAAFARRGMGLGAVAPERASESHGGVVESFTVGNDLRIAGGWVAESDGYCDADGVLDAGEAGELFVTFQNLGAGRLGATVAEVVAATPGAVFPAGLSFALPPSAPYQTVTATIPIALEDLDGIEALRVVVRFDDPALGLGARTATVVARVNTDSVASSTTTDDVESAISPWTASRATTNGALFTRRAFGPFDHRWFGSNDPFTADKSLTSPPLVVSSTGTFGFSFLHRHDLETEWDGGVIELSRDGGQTWEDIGAAASPTYPRALRGTGQNPLRGRAAYTGQSPSYPQLERVTVELGDAYLGETVQVRFRIGSDVSVGRYGWELDDLAFFGIDNTPFPLLVPDRGECVNRPPRVWVGPDLEVDPGTLVVLEGGGEDPDGDPLTFTWRQLAGPEVPLMDGSFVAPRVPVPTELLFELVVSDGELARTARSRVVVRASNQPPLVEVGPALVVEERSLVVLPGRASDPDGDPLVFGWTQLEGPSVELSDPEVPAPSFMAPEVAADTRLRFLLSVTDGIDTSTAALEVLVLDVNRAPEVRAGADQEVEAGAVVRLFGAASDPDDDPLTTSWVQLDGPRVVLEGAEGLEPSFTAPRVEGAVRLRFRLTVTDGQIEVSDTVAVRVTGMATEAPEPPGLPAGCGCSATGAEAAPSWLWVLGLLAPLGLRRQRRVRAAEGGEP